MILRRLGKLPPRHDPRTLKLSRYLAADVPAPPPLQDWSLALPEDVGGYRNHELAICGVAAPAHIIRTWTAQSGRASVPTQDEVEEAYSAIAGFDPCDRDTWNNPTDMLSVLRYWRRAGIGGRRILAFLKLDHDDPVQLRIAMRLFGPLYVGASLPRRVAGELARWAPMRGALRTREDDVGSWGGHAMGCPRLDRTGGLFYTWGRRQAFTWSWWLDYVDEAYAVLSMDWFNGAGLAPNGLDVEALVVDLMELEAA